MTTGIQVDAKQVDAKQVDAKQVDAKQVDAKQVDAKQVDAKQARYLLELAGTYTRQALAFPEQLQQLRATLAELLLENAALRWQLDRLAGRVDALERRAGSGGR